MTTKLMEWLCTWDKTTFWKPLEPMETRQKPKCPNCEGKLYVVSASAYRVQNKGDSK